MRNVVHCERSARALVETTRRGRKKKTKEKQKVRRGSERE